MQPIASAVYGRAWELLGVLTLLCSWAGDLLVIDCSKGSRPGGLAGNVQNSAGWGLHWAPPASSELLGLIVQNRAA